MKYDRSNYVRQLPKGVQEGILKAVARNLKNRGLSDRTVRDSVPKAMNSRIGDLEDVISVKYWLDKANGKVKKR